MHAPGENTTPSQSFWRRLIPPWEYRHLRAFAWARFAAGVFLFASGALMLYSGYYAWGIVLLLVAGLAFLFACLEMKLARTLPPRS